MLFFVPDSAASVTHIFWTYCLKTSTECSQCIEPTLYVFSPQILLEPRNQNIIYLWFTVFQTFNKLLSVLIFVLMLRNVLIMKSFTKNWSYFSCNWREYDIQFRFEIDIKKILFIFYVLIYFWCLSSLHISSSFL